LISQPQSRFPIYVVPTDEERMIARHTLMLLSGRGVTQRVRERV
jgi:acetate kinase